MTPPISDRKEVNKTAIKNIAAKNEGASSMKIQLDEYALEIAYEVLGQCDINNCQELADATRKTITTYLRVADEQKKRKIKRQLLPIPALSNQ